MLHLDHIVITAETLGEGIDHVQKMTGLEMPKGGEHPLMGTHNRVMRLGVDEFLEVIAVNPEAPTPERPRWFGLDHVPDFPRLAHWVVRCDDMSEMQAYLKQAQGSPIAVTRDALRWLLTVPEDGSLPMDGALPSVIQWKTQPLPPLQMEGGDAELIRLTIQHPRVADIGDWLQDMLNDDRIILLEGPQRLSAEVVIGGKEVAIY